MKQEVNFRLSAYRYNETTYILNVKLIVSSWCYIDALLQLSWRWEWDCEREWDERGNLTAAREQAWRSKIAVQYATTERVGRTPGNWENNDEVRWLIEHLHTLSSGDLRRHKLANQLSHRLATLTRQRGGEVYRRCPREGATRGSDKKFQKMDRNCSLVLTGITE